MVRTSLFGCISIFVLLISSGCCVHRGAIGPSHWDPLMSEAACTDCGDGAEVMQAPGCDSCAAPGCGKAWWLFGPLKRALTCGSGCGELYIDEWISDPPDCCDPGDNWGNWVGPQACCKAHGSPLHRRNLWGTRLHHHNNVIDDVWYDDGEVIIDETWSEEVVTPQPEPASSRT